MGAVLPPARLACRLLPKATLIRRESTTGNRQHELEGEVGGDWRLKLHALSRPLNQILRYLCYHSARIKSEILRYPFADSRDGLLLST